MNTGDQFVKCIAYNEVNLQDHIVHANYFPSSTLWVGTTSMEKEHYLKFVGPF